MLAKLMGVRIFDLEASGACNLNCPFCPRELLPPTGVMSKATYERFLDQVELGPVDTVSFVGIGEPTLNRNLPYFLSQTKSRYPKARTWITSNGTLLNNRILPPLLDAGLDTLDVSFNGLEKEAYERLMKGAVFEKVIANLEYTANEITRRSVNTRLQINFILSKENADQEESIKEFWRSRGIQHFQIHRMHDRNGAVDTQGMTPLDAPGLKLPTCAIFDVITFVTWEGDVMYCCHDISRKHKIGNINTDNWSSIQERKRSIMAEQKWPSMCASCTDPLRHDMRTKIDQMIRSEISNTLRTSIFGSVNRIKEMALGRKS